MRISLITITHKMPSWVKDGFDEYTKRLPANAKLDVIEIAPEKRQTSSVISQLVEREGEKLLAQTKARHHVIALDVKGTPWSTEQLAQQLNHWMQQGDPIDLLVGGPDGLSAACLARANETWSLSRLTFPHFFVRLILAEQLYRAHSLLQQHPYHR